MTLILIVAGLALISMLSYLAAEHHQKARDTAIVARMWAEGWACDLAKAAQEAYGTLPYRKAATREIRVPGRPVDGQPLDEEEFRAMAGLWGMLHADPVAEPEYNAGQEDA